MFTLGTTCGTPTVVAALVVYRLTANVGLLPSDRARQAGEREREEGNVQNRISGWSAGAL
jgi:hypothetical protein